MDRDEFLAVMIAELSRQKEASPETFLAPRSKSPIEIFRKLCFDYPDVSEKEITELSKAFLSYLPILLILYHSISPSLFS